MNLAKMIKEERERQGLSRKALAEAANVTVRAICYWESGKRKMSVESADRVFKALHLSVTIGEKSGGKADAE